MFIREVLEKYFKLNIKYGSIVFDSEDIIITDFDLKKSMYFKNTNQFPNFGFKNDQLKQIANLFKHTKLDDLSFLMLVDTLEIHYKRFSCEIINNYTALIDFCYNKSEIDLNKFELCGSLDNKEIREMINQYKSLKIDGFRETLNYFYISNSERIITNGYIILKKQTNIKDCAISCLSLIQFINYSNVEIYKSIDKIGTFLLKSEGTEKIYISEKQDSFKMYNNYFNKLKLKMNLEIPNLKYLKDHHFLTFDLNKKELVIDNNNDNNLQTFKLNCLQLDYKFTISNKYFKMLKTNNESINLELTNSFKEIIFDNNFIFGCGDHGYNEIEFESENILNIQNHINQFESEKNNEISVASFNEIEPKKLTPKIATKKLKNKKVFPNEIVLRSKKRVIEVSEVIEVESIEVIEVENIEVIEVIETISETYITSEFDLIEFVYLNNFTDLENLDFYNVNYKSSRLYLEYSELTFNQLKNKIEVIELNSDFENKFHYFKNKQDLLKFTREKIKN